MDDGVRRRDAQAVEIRDRLLRRVDRHRGVEAAAAEPELGERDHVGISLDDEVRARDPEVDDAVLGVLGDVARPDEEQVDRRVRARDDERALGHLEREPRVGAEPKRRLGEPALGRDRELEAAVLARARERDAHRRRLRLTRSRTRAIATGSVTEPLRDARDGRRRGRHPLGDLDVRNALVEEQDGLPAVRERLELGQRAQVAEEALGLVLRPDGEDRVRELVEPRDRLDGCSRRCGWLAGRSFLHVSMLAC